MIWKQAHDSESKKNSYEFESLWSDKSRSKFFVNNEEKMFQRVRYAVRKMVLCRIQISRSSSENFFFRKGSKHFHFLNNVFFLAD